MNRNKILVVTEDAKAAGQIEFAARQFDLVPVRGTSFKEAISFLSDCPVCAVFFDAGLPLLDDIPPNIAAIPIVHGVYVQE
ncbi:MAG: hypothetical protein N3B18_08285, partial [Desulfobacterota bacterium]|nr:hypothetical protein [Thermodesulfobacteriota bacterium]